MAVYLFTYHAYGSWMPDREQGYVQRSRGIIKSSKPMAECYREAMKETEVAFDAAHWQKLIDTIIESQSRQTFHSHGVATDRTHLHTIISWKDERTSVNMRAIVKGSLSRGMKAEFGKRTWFVEGASRKRVRDRKHYDYLREVYLPKHAGLVWIPRDTS